MPGADAIAAVTPAELPGRRHQGLELVQVGDNQRHRHHQFFLLLRHVRLEHQAERRVELKQPAIVELRRLCLERHDPREAELHDFDLAGGHNRFFRLLRVA
jgi:hypothetical protein